MLIRILINNQPLNKKKTFVDDLKYIQGSKWVDSSVDRMDYPKPAKRPMYSFLRTRSCGKCPSTDSVRIKEEKLITSSS